MLNLFKPHLFYLRILKNKLELKHIESGKTIKRTAVKAFSNERLLIADFSNAEELLRILLAELTDKNIFQPRCQFVVQPVDDVIKDISQVEMRAYIDICEHAGGSVVKVYDKQELLTDEQVKEILRIG